MSETLDLGGRRVKRAKVESVAVKPRAKDPESLSECPWSAVVRCVVLSCVSFLVGDTDVDSDVEIRSVELSLHANNSADNRVLTSSLAS